MPATWEEFTAAMDKAKAGGLAPLAVGGKDGWPLTQWTDPVILRVAGAEKFNQLARARSAGTTRRSSSRSRCSAS